MKRWLFFLSVCGISISTDAQEYFGQNKVQYDQFQFKVYNTPHFAIHYYEQEEEAVKYVGQLAEIWYDRISGVMNYEFTERNPIILYASPEHFAQTDIIPGIMGEGVGGVTEGNLDRVIMPLSASWQDNNHVLGHELVHAFQYRMLQDGDSTSIRNITNLPLWMVEGLAEYLSIGAYDPNTTKWIRDAIINDKFPTVQKLSSDYRYFPYRWGQAFWAYVAGTWGEEIIPRLFKQSSIYGYDVAIQEVLGLKVKEFNEKWETETKVAFQSYLASTIPGVSEGTRMFEDRKSIEEQDFAPAISPNGKYVVFLSARNLFSLDLYLADARTRKIIRKLKTERADAHANSLRLIESAATWSSDSRSIAYFAYEGGEHYLKVVEAESDKNKKKILIPKTIHSALNPAWSPDGKKIAFVGVTQGSSNLYVYDFKKEEFDQLTNDNFADLQPSWTPDSKSLVFVTDRFSGTDFSRFVFGNFEIARINAQTKEIREISLFEGVNHINPQYSKDSTLYFLASPDGVSNIYRLNRESNKIEQVTRESTAASGITDISPSLSLGLKSGDIIYSVYKGFGYQLYAIRAKNIKAVPVELYQTDLSMGKLPPFEERRDEEVMAYTTVPQNEILSDSTFNTSPYRAKLKLANVSNAGVGIGVGPYGTGLAGAVTGIWSDMLDEHIVFGALQAAGTFQDIGGIVGYLNQKHRLSWGFNISHIPYGYVNYLSFYDTTRIDGVLTDIYNLDNYVLREFNESLSGVVYYPLSRVHRVEAGLGVTFVHYSYRVYRDRYTVDAFGYPVFLIDQETFKLDAPEGFEYGTASLAFVADRTKFGFTSPLDGYRYRIGTDAVFGDVRFSSLLADFRFYKYVKPVSFAVRGLHYGRYFGMANDSTRIAPLTIGVDYLIRGYNYYSIDYAESPTVGTTSPTIDRLFGSKMAVINLEARFPLTGPREIAPIKSLALPSTIQIFFDGGVTWGSNAPTLKWTTDFNELALNPTHYPVFSTGVSLRVNVLGALVIEGYYAIPFQRPLHDPFNKDAFVEANSLSKGVWGILLYPGW